MPRTRQCTRAKAALLLLPAVLCILLAAKIVHADVSLGAGFEPTIAVDPRNPHHIAMARWASARVSADGGATWSPEIPAPIPPGYRTLCPLPDAPPYCPGGDSSLAFDSQGRLFWSYLVNHKVVGSDLFVTELDATTGSVLAGPHQVTATGAPTPFHDKPWMTADANPYSPFADRLYAVWTRLRLYWGLVSPSIEMSVLTSYSTDHGVTWSTPAHLTGGLKGYPIPAHVASAPNGDVYVAYHEQLFDESGAPDGVSGKVSVARSTDGGMTWPQRTRAFQAGQADITFNQQDLPGAIPGAVFLTLGSVQPWLAPDPVIPGAIAIIAVDDPDDVHGSGDATDVYIVRSTDHGRTWTSPLLVSDGPAGTLQLFPTAATDPVTGLLAVAWYDNRKGQTNAGGNYLFDVRYALSDDGGQTFAPSLELNNIPFDPDLGAFVKDPGPPATLWIGEYFGISVNDGMLSAVWTGNVGTELGTLFNRVTISRAPRATPP